MKYIYQNADWPHFTWNNDLLLSTLSKVRNLQGRLMGKMEAIGFNLRNEAVLETLTLDVIKTTEIEGEILNLDQVRSSLAKHLGVDIGALNYSDRSVDGIVDLIMDATKNCNEPISADRLFSWHAALFPTGQSGLYKITVGSWRIDSTGPMQVVSGAMGKEQVHYQAPDSSVIPREMEQFMDWFNAKTDLEPVLKAAIAHLWFVTLHPFEDGNGRIGRALTDMLLARSDGSTQRFYSMSSQIRKERKTYYDILERTQKGGLDITDWLSWFLNCLLNTLISSDAILAKVMSKAGFWKQHSTTILNERQRLMLNRLLDGFEGKLTSSKWAKITKCSQDTAIRDIQDLMNKAILQKEAAGGRSTNYELLITQEKDHSSAGPVA
jgi:Fic family protein